jgi:hypothetical protein
MFGMRKFAGAAYFIASILLMDTSVGLATLGGFNFYQLARSCWVGDRFACSPLAHEELSGFGYFLLFGVFAVAAVLYKNAANGACSNLPKRYSCATNDGPSFIFGRFQTILLPNL